MCLGQTQLGEKMHTTPMIPHKGWTQMETAPNLFYSPRTQLICSFTIKPSTWRGEPPSWFSCPIDTGGVVKHVPLAFRCILQLHICYDFYPPFFHHGLSFLYSCFLCFPVLLFTYYFFYIPFLVHLKIIISSHFGQCYILSFCSFRYFLICFSQWVGFQAVKTDLSTSLWHLTLLL